MTVERAHRVASYGRKTVNVVKAVWMLYTAERGES